MEVKVNFLKTSYAACKILGIRAIIFTSLFMYFTFYFNHSEHLWDKVL